MVNAIKVDNNKVTIDLLELKNIKLECIIKHLKEIVYLNSIDVFHVISSAFDNEKDEFYFLKEYIKSLKDNFSVFLMLETGFFASTNFYDSIFALGADGLTLLIKNRDEATKEFKNTINYITSLWPSGAVFADVIALDCPNDLIAEKIAFYSKLKVIPKIVKRSSCDVKSDTLCIRDLIINNLKDNGVSLKWVINFELCSVIQQASGKGRSRRRLAGKFALELASLRRKLMVKEVQNSFDSASL